MLMNLMRIDVRRARHDRCARRSASPAQVLGPLVAGTAVIVASGLLASWVGLSSFAVVLVVALVTAVVTVAAHRTIGSLAAGAGIRLARPFLPGERVRTFVPSVGQVVEAEIVRVGAANTTLLVREPESGLDSLVVLPNSAMLRGAPAPDSAGCPR